MGIPHVLFVFVLVTMMFFWAPHKDSGSYAYSVQIDEDAEDKDIGASTNTLAVETDAEDTVVSRAGSSEEKQMAALPDVIGDSAVDANSHSQKEDHIADV